MRVVFVLLGSTFTPSLNDMASGCQSEGCPDGVIGRTPSNACPSSKYCWCPRVFLRACVCESLCTCVCVHACTYVTFEGYSFLLMTGRALGVCYYMCIKVDRCLYIYILLNIHARTHTQTDTRAHTHTDIYIYIYIYICIYVCVCTHCITLN